ncbi:MAG: ribonuclease E/G [Micavibrio sp.]
MDIIIEEMDGGLWVAATQRGRLYGLEIDPPQENVRWGSIYRGKVARIDKSLDAAFIDLGEGNEGILHNQDIRLAAPDGKTIKGGGEPVGKLLRPGQFIIVQAKSGYLKRDDEFEFIREDKTARLSMDITLPGRFLIHAPLMEQNQVSSRIRNKDLRSRMMTMMNGFAPLHGLILRASSEDTQMDILLREAKILNGVWTSLQEKFEGSAPALLLNGPDAFIRSIGDQAGFAIERIELSTMEQFKLVEEWCQIFAPDLVTRIHPIAVEDPQGELALFDYRGLLGDIEDLFQEYGLLRSGGSIIIQETAALTAIDVNRGSDDRPAYKVNMEAAEEIARQIRLRNIGGIVLIDFLKFSKKSEQANFLSALTAIFDTDPCTVQLHGLTALGLLELTRKRRTPPLSERMDIIDGL